MYDQSNTLQQFLAAAAARQPTPGGGSVTALCGALASAMGEMVINYSLGKKDLAAYEAELRPALESLHRARTMMLTLMVEDQEAYAALTAARKLPAGAHRDAAFAAALKACIAAPQAIGATAVAVLSICDQVINFVNFYLLSDLAVCADLAMATTRCAIYNVRVNLADVTDAAQREQIQATTSQLLAHAAALIQRVAPRIWERHGSGR
ncbi:MAG TPA: cyclodeaminase/cyclohydrolase family protein [Tepidisphaeraceae bacterium]|jgi:glutamate formiminotransferase/formiminotetrahydrofolate cyclodeaminase|nr:cyclodeaminase/cyclohydrolase family protein [Tepidisphaeraceae bacterium]